MVNFYAISIEPQWSLLLLTFHPNCNHMHLISFKFQPFYGKVPWGSTPNKNVVNFLKNDLYCIFLLRKKLILEDFWFICGVKGNEEVTKKFLKILLVIYRDYFAITIIQSSSSFQWAVDAIARHKYFNRTRPGGLTRNIFTRQRTNVTNCRLMCVKIWIKAGFSVFDIC